MDSQLQSPSKLSASVLHLSKQWKSYDPCVFAVTKDCDTRLPCGSGKKDDLLTAMEGTHLQTHSSDPCRMAWLNDWMDGRAEGQMDEWMDDYQIN